jgi:hypothetical protein
MTNQNARRRQTKPAQKPGRRPQGYTASRQTLHDGLEASRSSVDGIWRIWGIRPPEVVGIEGRVAPVPVILGAHEKLAEAAKQARSSHR